MIRRPAASVAVGVLKTADTGTAPETGTSTGDMVDMTSDVKTGTGGTDLESGSARAPEAGANESVASRIHR